MAPPRRSGSRPALSLETSLPVDREGGVLPPSPRGTRPPPDASAASVQPSPFPPRQPVRPRKTPIAFLGSPVSTPRAPPPDIPTIDVVQNVTVNHRSSTRPIVDPSHAFDPKDPRVHRDILRMISQYLRSTGYHTSASVVADEAGLHAVEADRRRTQVKQLCRSIIDGDWDAAAKTISKVCSGLYQRRCLFMLHRQEFLELIQRQEPQRAFTVLNKRLKPLEDLASTIELGPSKGVQYLIQHEFSELCYLLTCRSVQDSHLFQQWPGDIPGRELVADNIGRMAAVEHEHDVCPCQPDGSEILPHRLVTLLQQATAFQMEFSRYRTTAPAKVTSLLRDYECSAVPNSVAHVLRGHCTDAKCLAFVGDQGNMLVSGGADGRVLVWDTELGGVVEEGCIEQPREPLLVAQGHKARVWDVASNARGDLVASVDATGVASLWRLPPLATLLSDSRATGEPYPPMHRSPVDRYRTASVAVAEVTPEGSRPPTNSPAMAAARDLYTVAWSPGGQQLVTGSHNRRLHVMDVGGGGSLSVVQTLSGHEAAVTEARFTPSGGLIASCARDGTVRFWDVLSGLCVKTLEDPGTIGEATSLALSSDGTLLLTSTRHGSIRLWDLRTTDRPIQRYAGHRNSVSSFIRCDFAAADSVVVSGSDDGAVHVWETATGEPYTTLLAHRAPVYRAAWSPRQGLLASCSQDGEALLWAWDGSERRFTRSKGPLPS
uniref:CTLH domain-containing protein n=1 Tax=Rhizochromulina marina TaxID=1034831 RepID=A0A7S2SNE6_9STRA